MSKQALDAQLPAVRLTKLEKEQLQELADVDERSLSNYVRRVLVKHLADRTAYYVKEDSPHVQDKPTPYVEVLKPTKKPDLEPKVNEKKPSTDISAWSTGSSNNEPSY